MPDTKRCNTCMKELPTSSFYPNRHFRDGLRSECRACTRAYEKRRRDTKRGGMLRYTRRIRIVPNVRGNDSFLVAIPSAAYEALGRPGAIQWTVRGDMVEIEPLDLHTNQ